MGFFGRSLLDLLHLILKQKSVAPGVIRPELGKNAQLQITNAPGGVIKAKSPKEVAKEQEVEFNNRYGI